MIFDGPRAARIASSGGTARGAVVVAGVDAPVSTVRSPPDDVHAAMTPTVTIATTASVTSTPFASIRRCRRCGRTVERRGR